MPFNFIKTEIPGIIYIEPKIFNDERGYFLEKYKKSEFYNNGIKYDFIQDNLSFSTRNVLRGLHFQNKPYAQGKLVSVIKGKILDVAVNIDQNSKYFKKYVMRELSSEKNNMLFIPPEYAHGFYAFEDSIVYYKTTNEYNKDYESGIIWNDRELNIKWPVNNPELSIKDKQWKTISETEIL
jgi:dTDP-4-dehydrorhamnose 3,5-epimerase